MTVMKPTQVLPAIFCFLFIPFLLSAKSFAPARTNDSGKILLANIMNNMKNPSDSVEVDSTQEVPTEVEMKIGARNEIYDASGIDDRRPRRATLFDITGKATSSTYSIEWDAHLSTEELNSAQAVDFVTIYAEMYNIGKLVVGDLAPRYSEYGLNGITVRGADVAVRRGIFELQVTSGILQRAVEGDTTSFIDGTFMRYLAAGQLSIGDEKSTIFHLGISKVKDKLESIVFTGFTRPQESLIGTFNFSTYFFDDKLRWTGEANLSDHTRDTRSEEYKDQVTLFGQALFKTRLSSRVSQAYFSTVDLKLSDAVISAKYKRVNPGYTSLGTIRTNNDYQDFSVDGRYSIFQRTISARTFLSYRHDNLDDTKIATSKLVRLLQTGYFTLSRNFSFSLSYSLFLDRDNNFGDTVSLARDGLTHGITFSPFVTFGSNDFFNRIYGMVSLNRLTNGEGAYTRSNYDNYNFLLAYSYNVGASFSSTISNTFVRMLQTFATISINTTELILEPIFFRQTFKTRLRGSFSYTTGKLEPDRHWEAGLGLEYRFTTLETLSLQLRSTWHNTNRVDGFSEFRWWINYIHDIY